MGMKGAFLIGDGRGRTTRTNGLDVESAMPYTGMRCHYRGNRNVFSACHSQVVWCPKYRRKVLIPPFEAGLKQKLPTLWTTTYFVSTTQGAPLSLIKQDCEQQKHV
jgi:REP element-mobilizing transposase RayT